MSDDEYDHLARWDMIPPPYAPLPPEDWRDLAAAIIGWVLVVGGAVLALIGLAWLLGLIAEPARPMVLAALM